MNLKLVAYELAELLLAKRTVASHVPRGAVMPSMMPIAHAVASTSTAV